MGSIIKSVVPLQYKLVEIDLSHFALNDHYHLVSVINEEEQYWWWW